jgi:hypothetical protein
MENTSSLRRGFSGNRSGGSSYIPVRDRSAIGLDPEEEALYERRRQQELRK